MKINFKITLLFILAFTMLSCSNDNDQIDEKCDINGASFVDPIDDKNVLIPESKLFVGYISPSQEKGAMIEIYEKNNRSKFMFLTSVITLNEKGIGDLHLNNTNYTVQVTCKKAGAKIGDKIWYTFILEGKKGEFCVTIQDAI